MGGGDWTAFDLTTVAGRRRGIGRGATAAPRNETEQRGRSLSATRRFLLRALSRRGFLRRLPGNRLRSLFCHFLHSLPGRRLLGDSRSAGPGALDRGLLRCRLLRGGFPGRGGFL